MDNIITNLNTILLSFNSEYSIYLQNFLILLIGLIIAKLVYLGVNCILRIIKLDWLIEKIGLSEILTKHITDIPSRILSKICYWLVITVMLSLIVKNFGFFDITILLRGLINFISQILTFIGFVIIGYYILYFFNKILSISLSFLSFRYYKYIEKFIFIIGMYGIIYYSLPIITVFNENYFITATFFVLKCSVIGLTVLIVLGFKDGFYNFYLHFIIKSMYKTGDMLIVKNKQYVINKIELFYVSLLSSKKIIHFDNKKFYKQLIQKM